LIGYTGFVGSTLAATEPFDVKINRSNLDELRGGSFDRIVCAGLPAAKWLANRDPEADAANMRTLMDALSDVAAARFVLISTIDVYTQTSGADEDFDCRSQPNHAYGAHRLQFEEFVRERFPEATIVRLPALFGQGLRKNVLYDLLNDNCLEMINPESSFQWYPLERLSRDLATIEKVGLRLVNLFPEPLQTRTILERFFPRKPVGGKPTAAAAYDLYTRHARAFGSSGRYMMSRGDVLAAMERFIGEANAK